jgi:hypothetical protein
MERAAMDYVVRHAEEEDLESLVLFTVAEAREAEVIVLDPDVVRRGAGAGSSDPGVALYWVGRVGPGGGVGSTSVVREWSDGWAGSRAKARPNVRFPIG